MANKLKLSSGEAKALLQALKSLTPGEMLDLPTPLPGLPGAAQAVLVKSEGQSWWLNLRLLGVTLQSFYTVKVEHNELVLEVL